MGVGGKRVRFIPVAGYFFDSQTLVSPSISCSGGESRAGGEILFC